MVRGAGPGRGVAARAHPAEAPPASARAVPVSAYVETRSLYEGPVEGGCGGLVKYVSVQHVGRGLRVHKQEDPLLRAGVTKQPVYPGPRPHPRSAWRGAGSARGGASGTLRLQTLSGGNAPVLRCLQDHQVLGLIPEVGGGGSVMDADPGWGRPQPSRPARHWRQTGWPQHHDPGQVAGAGGLCLDYQMRDLLPSGDIQASWLDVNPREYFISSSILALCHLLLGFLLSTLSTFFFFLMNFPSRVQKMRKDEAQAS